MNVKKHINIEERSTNRRSLAHFTFLCLVFVCFVLGAGRTYAQSGDSLRISIVTCAPGDDMYTLFGHTAIRVRDFEPTDSTRSNYREASDWLFNYGAFDFRADRFVYRFVKGETDYILAAEPSCMFFDDLAKDNRLGTEQVLNLTASEKKRLFSFLRYNIRPENRMYRYNWLYYNCTNRAKEVVEKAVEGKVVYLARNNVRTAREILGDYTKVNSWITFGLDLILGNEIDRPLSTKNLQMFIPQIYEQELDSAVIEAEDGTRRPLVSEVLYPVEGRESGSEDMMNQPLIVMTVLLAVIVAVSVYELRRRKTFAWIDVAVVSLIGLTGCLVAFLFFMSDHPGTSTNAWVIMFNPLAFMLLPFIVKRKKQNVILPLLIVVLALQELVLFMTGQHVNAAMHILVCILFIRIIVWWILKSGAVNSGIYREK